MVDELLTIEEILEDLEDLALLDEKYSEGQFYYSWLIDNTFGYDQQTSSASFK